MGNKVAEKKKHPRGLEVIENEDGTLNLQTTAELCGLPDAAFATTILINQALNTSHSELTNKQKAKHALGLIDGIRPQDAIEGMLATQMIAVHNMALECSRMAMLKGQTFEGRDMNMRHATRLMNTFSNAVTALDKHRGKGQQKITVEHQHIQVESGGQAIVGDVHHGGGANGKGK